MILVLIFQMTACVTPAVTTDEELEEIDPVNYPEGFPAQLKGMNAQYDDTVVEIIYVEGVNTYTADSLTVDPDAGDINDIDESIIERNMLIREYLGVTLDPFTDDTLSIGGLYSYAKIYFSTQDPALDVYAGYQYYDLNTSVAAHLLDISEIKNHRGETIVDIEQPYWGTAYVKEINPANGIYWVTGDLAQRFSGGFYCTFVNRNLYELYVMEHYGFKEICEIVDAGDWTIETMMHMASLVYDDADDSRTATEQDRLGFVYEPGCLDGFAYGCNVSFSKKTTDENGNESRELILGGDENAKKLAGYLKTLTTAEYAYNAGDADSQNMMPVFAAGKTLFCIDTALMAGIYLDDAPVYEILPLPKLDQNQEGYSTGLWESVTVFGISRYSDCPELAAAALEAMSALGRKLVIRELYRDLTMQCRCCIGEYSEKNLMSFSSICRTDFAIAWGNSLDGVDGAFRDASGYDDFSAHVADTYPDTNKKLAALVKALEDATKK